MNVRDTVLLKVPHNNVINAIQDAAKKGALFNPITPKEREIIEVDGTRLLGPLYIGGAVVITAEELSWALRKGYLRSELYGPVHTFLKSAGTGSDVDEWVRPRVRYVITQKGVTTKLWF